MLFIDKQVEIKNPLDMKIQLRQILEICNPISFYTCILTQNYLVKNTGVLFIFTSVFVPTALYIVLTFLFRKSSYILTYKEMIGGAALSIIDFLIIYLCLNMMLSNSSYLLILLVFFPWLIFIQPAFIEDLAINCTCGYLFYTLVEEVIEYEITGSNYWTSCINFYKDVNFGWFALLCCGQYFLNKFLSVNFCSKNLNSARILFLFVLCCSYVLIDRTANSKEECLLRMCIVPIAISTISSTIWLLTLSYTVSIDMYFVSFVVLSFVYFTFPTSFLFKTTRTESALYGIYILLFVAACVTYFVNSIRKMSCEEEVENLS